MTQTLTPRQRQRRPRTKLLHAYAALRMQEHPATLGAIDWLLWGSRENPYEPGTKNHAAYNRAYDAERRRTPRPQGTRLRRTK